MDTKFNKPKRFGEILDHTFSLSKNRFSDFFLILLIFMGPVYLLQAIIDLFAGASFFRALGSGEMWYEQIVNGFAEPEEFYGMAPLVGIGGGFITGILGIILFPIGKAAILFAINHLRNNEDYTVGSVIKEAFSRFWPILGSTILFSLIIFGIIVIPLYMIILIGFFGAISSPTLAIIISILLFLGFAVLIGYLLTRWSFYFGSVVLDRESPGFTRSWGLTRNRTWVLMGLYIIFYLIITSISTAVEFTFGMFLGNSVLFAVIVNIISLFTTLFFNVGYAVIYLDLKTRNDAEDLKEMIQDYKSI
ncbi:hypothetical protein KDN24_11510 [Bacillus sp. Bva_UNVM-123]|uniref:hypothetical protein n=1 Tax=Bacillus sp. Bva_UNVM-123 TaxID=2829798 RepID=UPI00391F9DA7